MRAEIEKLARGRRTAVRLALRAKIIRLAAEGLQNKDIATELRVCRQAVGEWRRRFAESGIVGIEKDATRPGRRRKKRQKLEHQIAKLTTQSRPEYTTHRSTRPLAAELGADHVLVHRVWKAHGPQPHRVRSFRLSRDPRFVEKLTDVVGLYMNSPQHAIVLSVDEKCPIEALDRSQRGLPIKRGRRCTMTHDYQRNRTTTLFAAIDTLEGTLIAQCIPQYHGCRCLLFRVQTLDDPRGRGVPTACIISAKHSQNSTATQI